VVAAAVAVLGGAIAPVLETGSRTLVQQSGASASSLRIEALRDSDAEEQDVTIRDTVAAAFRDVGADVVRSVTAEADVTIADDPVTVLLLADPGVADAASLVAGTWPSGPDETAILDAAAARLGIAPGAVVALGDGRELTVTGTWRALDPAEPRWFDDPEIGSGADEAVTGPLLVDESVLADDTDAARLHEITARWTIVPNPDDLGPTRLVAVADALARLDTEVRRMSGGSSASLEGDLAHSVARATRVSAVAAGVIGLPLVLVVLAGGIVLGLIARAIAGGRGGEFVLLRARGASMPALAGAAARESLLVSVVGAAVGAGLAIAALWFGLPLLGARAELNLVVPAAIAAGVALLAVTLATSVTVVELRAPVTGRAEAGRAAVVASAGPLVLVLIVAGLALAQFLSLGSPVIVRRDGIVRTDPLALTAPVLVLLAGALLAPVIAGPAVSVAERFARGARGILPVLPLRQLSRRARAVAAAVLVIALAAGSIVVAVLFQLQASDARLHAERTATGADLRLELPSRNSIDSSRPGASAALLDGVEAVDGGFPVLSGVASVGADAVPLIAADVAAVASLPDSTPELASAVDDLVAARTGAQLPSGATGLTVRADLSPLGALPEGLELGVVAWLADEHGGALRADLGVVPVAEGAAEVTGDIPAASAVLAIEFDPPGLAEGALLDVTLTEVQTREGDRVAFDGSSTVEFASGQAKIRRVLPGDESTDPLLVIVSGALAERLGLTAGSDFVIRVNGVPAPLPVRVQAVSPGLPGNGIGAAMLLDLHGLEGRAVELGGSVPAANELWVRSRDPDAAAAELRTVLTQRTRIVTPRTLSPAPLLEPTLVLVELGVAVTVLLAVLGFAAVAASIGQRRRSELAPLRSLGLSVARIRSARVIELAATAVIALLLGALAGWLTATLVVPGLVGVLV
jgi:hypothetical protein